jgi:tripartite-type tricarboxylate transporter receptor subunit TctC
MYRIASCIVALWVFVTPALADTIRMIVPFAAGGAVDQIARLLASDLAKVRGDSVVVENIGGAGGMLAMSAVAKAVPDGRTILLSPSGNVVINPALQSKLPYDPVLAFEPVVLVGSTQTALIVRSSLNVHSLAELVALGRSGVELTYGSAGIGTNLHIAGEMLNNAGGLKATHIPYRGLSPAVNSLIGGHIDFMITSVIGVLPYVQTNTARALAVFDTERSPRLPGVPTTGEAGYPDLIMPQWYGILVPAGVPAAIRNELEAQFLKILQSREIIEQLSNSGVAGARSAAEFRILLDSEFKKWATLLPKLRIKKD